MPRTELDREIETAVQQISVRGNELVFDSSAYISSFKVSAQEKAKSVLAHMQESTSPVFGLRPVFVSVGGGSGDELQYLLEHSNAKVGILLEYNRELAETARRRSIEGKTLIVVEGDANNHIVEAMRLAADTITSAQADYIAVTCHAVIHELFDRGKEEFDPIHFFGSIFGYPEILTWFTYREPGVPEKWPETILIRANCTPQSLLLLTEAIRDRHPILKSLRPFPQVVGDRLRVHRVLGMELLVKLFYLPSLKHELEERSTSVDHTMLMNTLWLAIGESAQAENRAGIQSFSAPTQSFVEHWRRCAIDILGLTAQNTTFHLAVPESQSRIVAWRQAPADHLEESTPRPFARFLGEQVGERPDLRVAAQAFATEDNQLLAAVLFSRGRAWIESTDSDNALRLLTTIRDSVGPNEDLRFWCDYLIQISGLFSGDSPPIFRPPSPGLVNACMRLLFEAEAMEFARKSGQLDIALEAANDISRSLSHPELVTDSSVLGGYAIGTSHFLLGNLARHGGNYSLAWKQLDRARKCFQSGIESHDTELAHCYYARAVCTAMTGTSSFDFPRTTDGSVNRFANALILLTYSHAAWFIDDIRNARRFALDAAGAFTTMGFPRYAERASALASMIEMWTVYATGGSWPSTDHSLLSRYVRAVTEGLDIEWFFGIFSSLRPSTALGLLQFSSLNSGLRDQNVELQLPRTLREGEDGTLGWHLGERVNSLAEADRRLRVELGISSELRVPLLAD
jgi:hypothetical protein